MGYVTAVPSCPRSEAAAPGRAGRRSLAVALLCGALGAAVALLATRQRWSEGTATVAGGAFPLTAKGSDVTGVPAALAIVGLAALVAVFAVRRAGRLAGLRAARAVRRRVTVAAPSLGAADGSALDEQAAQASGDTAATVAALSHTAWPYAAAAGGALILLAGLLALRYGRLWPAMSGRYERGGSPAPAAPAQGPSTPTGPRNVEGPGPGRGPDRRWTRLTARGRRPGLADVAHQTRPEPTPASARVRVRDNGRRASGSDGHKDSNEEQVMAGTSHGHTPAAWTGVTIAIIGFCVAGAFMVMAEPLGLLGRHGDRGPRRCRRHGHAARRAWASRRTAHGAPQATAAREPAGAEG